MLKFKKNFWCNFSVWGNIFTLKLINYIKTEKRTLSTNYFQFSLNWDKKHRNKEYSSCLTDIKKEIRQGKTRKILLNYLKQDVISWTHCCEVCVMSSTTMSFPCGQQEAEKRAGRQADTWVRSKRKYLGRVETGWNVLHLNYIRQTFLSPSLLLFPLLVCPSLYFETGDSIRNAKT